MRTGVIFLVFSCLVLAAGCVERTMTIRSEPPQARVYIDGKETGRTPLTVKFNWYGYREVMLQKDGYEIEREVVHLKPPLYERFPLDFFSDLLLPLKLHDSHEYSFTLRPKSEVEPEEVVKRARQMGKEVHPPVPEEKAETKEEKKK